LHRSRLGAALQVRELTHLHDPARGLQQQDRRDWLKPPRFEGPVAANDQSGPPTRQVAVAPDSWKARHIAISSQVAVTAPVRRGGVLSLLLPIPPATVSFRATAIVHPAGSAESHSLSKALEGLGALLPAERRASSTVIEIVPKDRFLTYGVGVSLMQMRSPVAARAHVPVR
jgi:hypothetical protein